MKRHRSSFPRLAPFLLALLLFLNGSSGILLAEAAQPAALPAIRAQSARPGLADRASRLKRSMAAIAPAEADPVSIYESEPNDAFDLADTISDSLSGDQDYMVFGTVTDVYSDLDVFRLTVPEDGTLDVLGIWVSGPVVDQGHEDALEIRLYDASREPVAAAGLYRIGDAETDLARILLTDIDAGVYDLVVGQSIEGDASPLVNQDYGLYVGFTQAAAPAVYQVAFDSKGGSPVEAIDVPAGSTVAKPADPTRTGHVFGGWHVDADCTIPWDFDAGVVSEDMTLYAKWTVNPDSAGAHTVTFDSMGGSPVSAVQVADGETVPKPADPTRAGSYRFGGWYREAAGANPWNFDTDVVTAPVTLYANWSSTLPGEGVEGFIVRFYQLCLGRDPDQGGLDYFVGQLKSGAKTGASVAIDFVTSPEFKAMNKTDSEYVAVMYRVFFDREADQGGLDYWLGQMDKGMSRFWVLAGFVNSQEFTDVCQSFNIQRGSITLTDPADCYPQLTAFVTRFYKLTLERMPDEGGLNYWVKDLADGRRTGASLADSFIFSEEFEDRRVSDTRFMEIMYAAFFDRAPDAGGMNHWLGRLALGYTRHYVLVGYVNAQEFAGICTSYGIQRGSIAQWAEDKSVSRPLYFNVGKDESGGIYLDWTALNTSGRPVTAVNLACSLYDEYEYACVDEFGRSVVNVPIAQPVAVDGQVTITNWRITSAPDAAFVMIDTVQFVFADGTRQTYAYGWYTHY